MAKFYRLAAVMMLIVVLESAYGAAIDDFGMPDEKKTPAQVYFDQVPDDSK